MDSILLEAPWPLLPIHILLLPFLSFAFTILSAQLWARAGLLAMKDLTPETHWTERARLFWPVRKAIVGALSLGIVAWGGAAAISHSHAALWPRWLLVTTCVLLAGMGAMLSLQPADKNLRESPLRRFRNTCSELLLRMPHMLVLFAMLLVLSDNMGPIAWTLYGLGAISMLVLGSRGALPLLSALGMARPASERVAKLVKDVGRDLDCVPRGVWEADWPMANALAFPVSQKLVVTPMLEAALDDAELSAIIAHEMGHLKEPRGVVLARVAPLALLVGAVLTLPLLLEGQILVYIVAMGAFIGVSMVVSRVRRRMEERADSFGHDHAEDPGTYARALEKIYKTNMIPAVIGARRAAHPDLYDRLQAAGVEPDYPRPEPPPKTRMATLIGLMVLVVGVSGWLLTPTLLPDPLGDNQGVAWSHLTFMGDEFGALLSLQMLAEERDDLDAALRFNTSLDRLEDGTNATVASDRVDLLILMGRCAQAREALEETKRREVFTDPEQWSESMTWLGHRLDACETPPLDLDRREHP